MHLKQVERQPKSAKNRTQRRTVPPPNRNNSARKSATVHKHRKSFQPRYKPRTTSVQIQTTTQSNINFREIDSSPPVCTFIYQLKEDATDSVSEFETESIEELPFELQIVHEESQKRRRRKFFSFKRFRKLRRLFSKKSTK